MVSAYSLSRRLGVMMMLVYRASWAWEMAARGQRRRGPAPSRSFFGGLTTLASSSSRLRLSRRKLDAPCWNGHPRNLRPWGGWQQRARRSSLEEEEEEEDWRGEEDDTDMDDSTWEGSAILSLQDEDSIEDGDGSVERELDSMDGVALNNDADIGEESNEEELEEDPLVVEYNAWLQALQKALTALDKKERSLSQELNKAASMEQKQYRAQLITNNLYLFSSSSSSSFDSSTPTTVMVPDWDNNGVEVEITLDTKTYSSAADEAAALYQQVRKLKRGSQVVQDLLEQTQKGRAILEEAHTDLQQASALNTGNASVNMGILRLVQQRLEGTSRQTGFQAPSSANNNKNNKNNKAASRSSNNKKPAMGTPASNVRKLLSPGGCIVLVGRNQRGNEYLSFTVARGNDVWMHSRGCPGAHVVLQQRRGSPVMTPDCVQFAANLAIFYSDARSETRGADVTWAEPKHLLKPRGAPLGALKLRREYRVVTGYPDRVPIQLQEARLESGQEELYRLNDKAKHRKMNKANKKKKQQQAKRKKKQQGQKQKN